MGVARTRTQLVTRALSVASQSPIKIYDYLTKSTVIQQ